MKFRFQTSNSLDSQPHQPASAQSNLPLYVGAVVMCTLIVSFTLYALLTMHVNDQAVDVVRQAIVRLESKAVESLQVGITHFEYRPGFKGKYVKVDYLIQDPHTVKSIVTDKSPDPQPAQALTRYFLIRKAVFGDWEVTYEIDEKQYHATFPGSGHPTAYPPQP